MWFCNPDNHALLPSNYSMLSPSIFQTSFSSSKARLFLPLIGPPFSIWTLLASCAPCPIRCKIIDPDILCLYENGELANEFIRDADSIWVFTHGSYLRENSIWLDSFYLYLPKLCIFSATYIKQKFSPVNLQCIFSLWHMMMLSAVMSKILQSMIYRIRRKDYEILSKNHGLLLAYQKTQMIKDSM